jgi:hypothetical protein
VPTGSFLLGYAYDHNYIARPRGQKKIIDDYVIKELVKSFTKELRKAFTLTAIPFEFLTSAQIDAEIALKLAYIDFSHLGVNPANQTVQAKPIIDAFAHYQPISTREHRVTYITPLLVKQTGQADRPLEIQDPTYQVKAAVVARLTWGIPLPAGQSEPGPLPDPHGGFFLGALALG